MLEHYLPESLFKARKKPPFRSPPTVKRKVRKRPSIRSTVVGDRKGKKSKIVLLGGNSHAHGYRSHLKNLYKNKGIQDGTKYILVEYHDGQGRGGELSTQLKRYKNVENYIKRKHRGVPIEGAYHVGFNLRNKREEGIFRDLLNSQKDLTPNIVVLTNPIPKKGWGGAKHRDRWRRVGKDIVDRVNKDVGARIIYNSSADYPPEQLKDHVHLKSKAYSRSGKARLPRIPYGTDTRITSRIPIPTTPTTQTPSSLADLKSQLRFNESRQNEYGDVKPEVIEKLKTQINNIQHRDRPQYKPQYKSSDYTKKATNRYWKRVSDKIYKKYGPYIDKAAERFGKTPQEQQNLKLFLAGTIAAETGGRSKLKGPVLNSTDIYGQPNRAYGLTQLLPKVARTNARRLGMSDADFDKKWKAGGWKDPEWSITLAASFYNSLKSQIQAKYKKKHNKDLVGEDLLNALHIAYSHGPNNDYFKKVLDKGDFSPSGFRGGRDAPGYNSKAAQTRSHYTKRLPTPVTSRPAIGPDDVMRPGGRSAPEWRRMTPVIEKRRKKIIDQIREEEKREKDKRKREKTRTTTTMRVEEYKPAQTPTSTPPRSTQTSPYKPTVVAQQAEEHKPIPQHVIAPPPPEEIQPVPQQLESTPPQHSPGEVNVAQQTIPVQPVPVVIQQRKPPPSIPTHGQRLMVSLGGASGDVDSINKRSLYKSVFRLERYKEMDNGYFK